MAANTKTTEKSPPKKPGRKSKMDLIDKDMFEKYVKYFSTKRAIADYFNVSEDTIERWVKKTYGLRFAEVAAQKQETTRNQIRAKMVETALDGNVTMMIFLAKNWLGMSDKPTW